MDHKIPCRVLSPIKVDGKLVREGDVNLDAADARTESEAGRVEILGEEPFTPTEPSQGITEIEQHSSPSVKGDESAVSNPAGDVALGEPKAAGETENAAHADGAAQGVSPAPAVTKPRGRGRR